MDKAVPPPHGPSEAVRFAGLKRPGDYLCRTIMTDCICNRAAQITGVGARKSDREVNMIRLADDAIRLATRVAHDGGAIRVELRSRVRAEERAAFLRAEDDVDDNEAQ
jgi:hypothetical protein